MPFDGAGFSENQAMRKLDTVLELLATEARWCKGSYRTSDGRHCLMGAIQATDARPLLEPIVLSAIAQETGRSFWRVESFNDHRSTTHALVLRVLARARERLLVDGSVVEPPRSRRGAWLAGLSRWLAACRTHRQ